MTLNRKIVFFLLVTLLFAACYKPTMSMPDAVKAGDIKAVQYYLKHGVSVDSKDENGAPLIFLAIEQGSPEIVNLLLAQYGALTKRI